MVGLVEQNKVHGTEDGGIGPDSENQSEDRCGLPSFVACLEQNQYCNGVRRAR